MARYQESLEQAFNRTIKEIEVETTHVKTILNREMIISKGFEIRSNLLVIKSLFMHLNGAQKENRLLDDMYDDFSKWMNGRLGETR